MTPVLYFNCDNTYDNAGSPATLGKLIDINGNQFGVAGAAHSFTRMYNFQSVIRSGYVKVVPESGTVANFSGINNLNDFSFAFWHREQEGRKLGGPEQEVLPYLSGTSYTEFSKYSSPNQREFSIGVRNQDFENNQHWRATFTLKNSFNEELSIVNSSIDPGRWNYVYCEYDKNLGRGGLSINGGAKSYSYFTTPSGHVVYSGNLVCSGYYCGIDEISVWSGCLGQNKIEEYYSNQYAFGYGSASGSIRNEKMFPISSHGNNSDEERWYKDIYQVYPIATVDQWEYVNDASYPSITNGFNTTGDYMIGNLDPINNTKRTCLNFGKCYVKPSSITVYTYADCVKYEAYGTGTRIVPASGYLQEVVLRDNNNSVFASSTYDKSKYFTHDIDRNYSENYDIARNNVQILDTENKDFSNINGSFSFRDVNDEYNSIKLFNVSLDVVGQPIAYTGLNLIGSGGIDRNANLDLYLRAYSSGLASKDLYLAGHLPDNSGIPFYTYGSQPINSGIDLYMYGWDTRSSGIDLFIGGQITLNSGCDLYMYGSNVDSAGLNLFTKYEPVERSGGFNLFTFSASDPTVQKSMDLYLKTALASSVVGNMNLYMTGPETGSMYGDMPLFLENNTYNYKSVELFLQNAYQSGFKGLKLFVDGEGTLNGGLPYNGSMPLFIERTEGAEKGLSMFMQVNNGVGSGLNMFTKGGTYSQSGLDMSIPSTYAENSGILKLMIRGY